MFKDLIHYFKNYKFCRTELQEMHPQKRNEMEVRTKKPAARQIKVFTGDSSPHLSLISSGLKLYLL